MAHGTQDAFQTTPLDQVYVSTDIGELAARLQGKNVWDRRGNVTRISNFGCGLGAYTFIYYNNTSSYWLDMRHSLYGEPSVALQAGLSTAYYSNIASYSSFPLSARVGIEYAFGYDSLDSVIWLQLVVDTGTEELTGAIYVEGLTWKLYYLNSGGTYSYSGYITPLAYSGWQPNFIKLVIDTVTKKYLRVIINSLSISLSSISLYVESSTLVPMMCGTFGIYGKAVSLSTAYVYHIIHTINEL